MKRVPLPTIGLMAFILLMSGAARASAASSGVRDEAHFFSPEAVGRAEAVIRQVTQKHQKDVLIETFPAIPTDRRADYEQMGKDRFFADWANERAKQNAVDGVYILITKEPGHLQVWDGNQTSQRLFPAADRDRLKAMLASAFREKQYDQGLEEGVRFIQQQMDAHAAAGGQTGSSRAAATPPVSSNPPPTNFPQPMGRSGGWGLGGIACVVIGVIILIMLVRAVIGRATGGYRPGGYYPPGGGGYPPGGGPGYPPGAGGYGYGGGGGGGGGFGRGLLGGLLGGALGGYVGEKFAERGQQGGFASPPPAGGGGDYSSGVDTSGTSSGADFDSGGVGGGGGADFSGGGGGADFGGGGADSSSGADFGSGGGGGDFGGGGGGGGDSGSSGGSDF